MDTIDQEVDDSGWGNDEAEYPNVDPAQLYQLIEELENYATEDSSYTDLPPPPPPLMLPSSLQGVPADAYTADQPLPPPPGQPIAAEYASIEYASIEYASPEIYTESQWQSARPQGLDYLQAMAADVEYPPIPGEPEAEDDSSAEESSEDAPQGRRRADARARRPAGQQTTVAAQQQELARLVGLIQQDPDAFMAGIGDGSIQINTQLTPDQANMLTQYVGVERAAQLQAVLGQMF